MTAIRIGVRNEMMLVGAEVNWLRGSRRYASQPRRMLTTA
jgi:hypothetical protein